jgi:hypothetical protein
LEWVGAVGRDRVRDRGRCGGRCWCGGFVGQGAGDGIFGNAQVFGDLGDNSLRATTADATADPFVTRFRRSLRRNLCSGLFFCDQFGPGLDVRPALGGSQIGAVQILRQLRQLGFEIGADKSKAVDVIPAQGLDCFEAVPTGDENIDISADLARGRVSPLIARNFSGVIWSQLPLELRVTWDEIETRPRALPPSECASCANGGIVVTPWSQC